MCRGRSCGDPHEHWWNEGSTGDRKGRPYKKSSVRRPKPRLWDNLRILAGALKRKALTDARAFLLDWADKSSDLSVRTLYQ